MHRVPAVSEGVVRVVEEARGAPGVASHQNLGSRRGERSHAYCSLPRLWGYPEHASDEQKRLVLAPHPNGPPIEFERHR
jgi:hypothetical protein